MTRFPLHLIEWEYDDETNRVTASLQERPSADNADPVRFRSELLFTIELVPLTADVEARPLPPSAGESV